MQLLDPDSPDYLGKAIGRFQRTPQQFMSDLINGAGASDVAQRATSTATGKDGQKIYKVDGAWVDQDGKPVKK